MTVRIERLSDDITLHLGDCRDILPTLGKVDVLLTDPPYGMDYSSGHATEKHVQDALATLAWTEELVLRKVTHD